MLPRDSEFEGLDGYLIKQFLRDNRFWGKCTKKHEFPRSVVAMQEIVEKFPEEKWIAEFVKVIPPLKECNPKDASIFSPRKLPTRQFYTAIHNIHASKDSPKQKIKALAERIENIQIELNSKISLREVATVGLMLVRGGGIKF